MKKKSIFFLAILCQLMLYANNETTNSVYIDSSISEFSTAPINSNHLTYHLFSHGRSGELFIDNQWMNVTQIAETFKPELKGKKELYIYGCNFGEGQKGLEAVKYLEKHLHINVNASTNITGENGDWKLELGKGKNSLKFPNYKGNLQLDNTHYLNPITSAKYDDTTIFEEYIYLSTPSTTNITIQMNYASGVGSPRVSITQINGGAVTYANAGSGNITISNATPVRLRFVNAANAVIATGSTPTTIPLNTAGTTISGNNFGLKFTSTEKFFVNYRARSTSQAGSMLTKGSVALGQEFRWGGSPVEFPDPTVPETGNMISIMATVSNTIVTISNIKTGTRFVNGTSGTTLTADATGKIEKTLNQGESFILYAPISNTTSIQDTGWLGAKVVSTSPVAVAVGGLMQQGGVAANRDIGFDQLVPVAKLGLEHIIMAGNGGANEKVIVIATADNTKVYLNDNVLTPYATLINAGDYILLPSTLYNTSRNIFVRVSAPSYVFQKIYGGTAANTNSLMFIPPLSCFGQKTVDLIPDASKIGTTPYSGTQVVVLAGKNLINVPKVVENGVQLPTPAAGVVTGNAHWLSYRYTLQQVTSGNPTPTSNVKISSEGTIFAEIFGASGVAGFGGYYSGFSDIPTYNITISNTGNIGFICVGQGTMTVAPGLGTYQWYRNGSPIVGAISNSYTLSPIADNLPASYYVVISLAGGCSVTSNQIESDICPCTKPGITGTPTGYAKMGISIRDNRSSVDWPKDVPNGFITLEANNKGMVITRIASPETVITGANAVKGMLVYDTLKDCLKLYNGTTWNCIKPTCN